MSVVLLDTTVASLLHPKQKGTEPREYYEKHMRGQTLALCFQSVAELWHWAEANTWGKNACQGLDTFVRRFLIIPYDYELARVWARVMEASRKEGRRFEAGDCWIAATAVHRNVPLLAHDKDYAGRAIAGLKVITYAQGAG